MWNDLILQNEEPSLTNELMAPCRAHNAIPCATPDLSLLLRNYHKHYQLPSRKENDLRKLDLYFSIFYNKNASVCIISSINPPYTYVLKQEYTKTHKA